MAKEKNSDNASATRDVEFRISISSEDIDKIETKVKNNEGDAKPQNNPLADGVVLTNTCENCSVKFVPKNNMTCEVWCEYCIGKKQNVIGKGVLPK